MSPLILTKFDAGVLHVSLNHPEKANSLTQEMIADLTAIFKGIAKVPETRVVVLRGEGKSFCGGADIKHIEETAGFTKQQHIKDIKPLSDLFASIATCGVPVIAIGQGHISGAGIGLLAAADIAVAFESTTFAFAEVTLGLMPSVITPYVVSRIGLTNARRFFLSGEIFQFWDAKEMGLVTYVGTKMACFEFLNAMITDLKKGAPGAQADVKALLDIYSGHAKWPADLSAHLIDLAARRRMSDEGREGVGAFLYKKTPPWRNS